MRVVWNLTLEQDSVGQIIYVTRRFFRKQSPALCNVEILCCKVKGLRASEKWAIMGIPDKTRKSSR